MRRWCRRKWTGADDGQECNNGASTGSYVRSRLADFRMPKIIEIPKTKGEIMNCLIVGVMQELCLFVAREAY